MAKCVPLAALLVLTLAYGCKRGTMVLIKAHMNEGKLSCYIKQHRGCFFLAKWLSTLMVLIIFYSVGWPNPIGWPKPAGFSF